MKFSYMLLNSLTPADFGCDEPEMIEALAEFGCSVVSSQDILGNTTYFAVAHTLEALEQMCNTVDLPGNCVKYSEVFQSVQQ